jgi:hypothetical protein
MSTVRPEYGPTLVELARPRWRRLPRGLRIALSAGAGVVVLLAALAVLRSATADRHGVVVTKPFAFNLAFQPGIERVAPHRGEALRLQSIPSRSDLQSYVVKPLHLPPYRGDVSAGFLIATATMADQMHAADPNFLYRGEGRARVNNLPGYQLLFVTKQDGKTVFGRRVLLVPDQPGARDGADITLKSTFSAAVVNVDAVGNNGLLKMPLRSFRFGTEHP